MRNLMYKEMKLSIHSFFYILPFILGLLMFIPMWIYTIVFMYFFWMSIIYICGGYNAKQDNSFNAMLPVSKKDIVRSKVYTIMLIEGLHLVTGIVFGIAHNSIYGMYNFFFDINVAFFAVIIVMFALFNIVFLPWYFKTAYFYGKPAILGITVVMIYAFIFEFGVIKFEFMRTVFEGDILNQMIVLLVGVVTAIILSYFTMKQSIRNFERIK